MGRTNVRTSALIIKDSKILLIHRKRDGEEYWVFPGGGVEDTETSEQGVIREVKEETNLDVIECKLVFMAYNESSKKEEPFYLCEVSDGKIEIIGEEKDKNNADNWYQLEWIDLEKIINIWLVPENAKLKVLELYTQVK